MILPSQILPVLSSFLANGQYQGRAIKEVISCIGGGEAGGGFSHQAYLGKPLKASATISPELEVLGPVSTTIC